VSTNKTKNSIAVTGRRIRRKQTRPEF
jgi:hypothetical protein